MILDMQNTNTNYFDQVKKTNKKYDKIYTCILKLE